MDREKFFLNFLKAAVSAAIIFFIISMIDLGKTFFLLRDSKIEFLLLGLILVLAQLVISAFNQKILLEPEKKIPFKSIFSYYCFGWAAGLVSVAKLGEFSASHYLKKEGIPYSKALAIIFLDKMVTLAVFILIAAIGTVLFFGFLNSLLLLFCVLLLLNILTFLFLFFNEKFDSNSLILKIPVVGNFVRDRKEHLLVFKKTFFEYFSSRKAALLKNTGLTLVKLLVMSLTGTVLFLAVNSSINPFYMVFIIAIAAIVALAPITFSGLGVVEATYIYLASLVGIGAETAIATELLTLFLNYLVGVCIAVFWMKKK